MTIKISPSNFDGYKLSIDCGGYCLDNEEFRWHVPHNNANVITLLMEIGKNYEKRICELANWNCEYIERIDALQDNMKCLQAECRKLTAQIAKIKKITA